jgi:hypothetical protein
MHSDGKKAYGTNRLLSSNTSWKHLYAEDTESIYSYTEKIAAIDTKTKPKRPFGPQTAKNLIRKLDNPSDCICY